MKIVEEMRQVESRTEAVQANLAAATADLHVEKEKSADLKAKLESSEAENSNFKMESSDQLNALR